MPFLAPLIPAIIGGIASAGVGAAVNGVSSALSGNKAATAAPVTNAVSNDQAQGSINTANNAVNQQYSLANQLSQQNGISNQSNVYGQQQALANQLGQMAQGGGPNPALDQLNQTTGQNVANQAALMAGQRGAGQNVGLIARQAAQQGANTQQQAVGQAATLRSQQQLGAIGALQNQQGMLGNLATQQVGQQTQAVGNLNQFAQGQQGQLLNQIQSQNQVAAGQQANVNNNNQAQNGINSQNIAASTKGLSSGLGSAVAAGVTKAFADGGPVYANSSNQSANLKEGGYKGRSKIGAHLNGYAQGGQIPMQQGGGVPGQAQVAGNSYANDTVDAKLSPGEFVVPKSVTESKNPKLVAALQVLKAATPGYKKGK